MRAVLFSALCLAAATALAQPPVGALAIDERQGDQYGWAVDYETPAAARAAALRECGAGCSVVLEFERCGAYAAEQNADSTAVGWAESYGSADVARQAALSECGSGGGAGCTVRAWGCNGHVTEEQLRLDRAARQQIQEGLRAAGFDPGGTDGLFGPRTRSAIRRWQADRGDQATGYLNGAAVDALRVSQLSATAAAVAPAQPPAASAELERLFWQSIMNSTNPDEFEAYLAQFPNGVFRALAEVRLAALRAAAGDPPSGSGRLAGSPASASRRADPGDAGWRPGEAFQDCDVCPQMVVLAGGSLALGRYEVTVGEYRAFESATGTTVSDRCSRRWPNGPDRHPVGCVTWNDAQAYASWLGRTTGGTYRLPTEAEWETAAAGSEPGCHAGRSRGTCPVGTYGSNPAGLSDMLGNAWEWTADSEDVNGFQMRVTRGGHWGYSAEDLSESTRFSYPADTAAGGLGFRVARVLD